MIRGPKEERLFCIPNRHGVAAMHVGQGDNLRMSAGVDGHAIALIPENSDRVAAAVAALRQAATPEAAPPLSAEERMIAIHRRFGQLAADYEELAASSLSLAEKSQVGAVLSNMLMALHRLELQRR